MRLLLDTHTLIWWHDEPHKLPPSAFDALSNDTNAVFISIASAWEIQIKTHLGKLRISKPLETVLELERRNNGFDLLSIELSHVLVLGTLPYLPQHKDPFDRLLIAQAKAENLVMVSHDQRFSNYPISLLW